MITSLPENFQLAYSAEEISQRVLSLAEEISPWAEQVLERTGEQVLALCVLNGGVHFFSDLVRALNTTVQLQMCRTKAYSSDDQRKITNGVEISIEGIQTQGRHVLIVDDICDTGVTLSKLKNVLAELGAEEVKSSVLVRRKVEDAQFVPDWVGFEYPGEEWFVGYGMDYDGDRYRNISGMYVITK